MRSTPSYVYLLAGDAAAQAAFTLKLCAYVKNIPLDHFPKLVM